VRSPRYRFRFASRLAPAWVVVGFLALTLSGAAEAQEAENVAAVLKTSGTVEYQRQGAEGWDGAERGLILNSGDKLRTARQSSVAVLFVDDRSLLKLAAETEVTFHATREGGTVSKRIWMGVGDLWARVTKAEEPHFEVETPTSVASVKGSEFYSKEDQDTGNTLFALSGLYQYGNDFGQIELQGGMTGKSDGQGPPTSQPTDPGNVPTFGGGLYGYLGGERELFAVGDPDIAPEELVAEAIAHDEITLTWIDVFADETVFEVERRLEGGSWQPLVVLGAGTTSHDDTELEEAATYCYRVRARADAAASEWSETACDETLLPTDPSRLTASVTGASEITITWEDNADGESAYEIQRSSDGSGFTMLATLEADAETYVDTEVMGFAECCYRVRAQLDGSETSFSNQDCASFDGGDEPLAGRRVIRIEVMDEEGERHMLVIPLLAPEGNE